MAKKAIKCSKMFDSTTSTVRENVVIFTDGERIEAVVPTAEAKFDGYEVIVSSPGCTLPRRSRRRMIAVRER